MWPLASTSFTSAFFGQGTGSINLVNVNCVGTETRLIDCPTGSQSTCSHIEDAGVRCSDQTSMAEPDLELSYKLLSIVIQIARMETSGWLEVAALQRVVWRCATVVCGGQCVVICGEWQMQL